MRNILKRVFTPFVIAILVGVLCGKIVYKIYDEELENKFSSDKIYVLQSGTYTSYDKMREDNMGKNYLYYVDNGIYKSILGITKKDDNIDKIRSIYSLDLTVWEYYLSDTTVSIEQDKYDKMLESSNDVEEEKEILNNVIDLYKANENIKLIKVNK